MLPNRPSAPTLEQKLDEALEQSFPASDPPAVYGDTPDERDTPEGEYQ